MFCDKCGKPNEDGALFCEFCGNKLETIAEESVQQVVQSTQEVQAAQEGENKQVENVESAINADSIDGIKNVVDVELDEENSSEASIAKKKDNPLVRFIKRFVGELDEGPIIKNKFVIFCIVITALVVIACLVIYIVHNVYITSIVKDI